MNNANESLKLKIRSIIFFACMFGFGVISLIGAFSNAAGYYTLKFGMSMYCLTVGIATFVFAIELQTNLVKLDKIWYVVTLNGFLYSAIGIAMFNIEENVLLIVPSFLALKYLIFSFTELTLGKVGTLTVIVSFAIYIISIMVFINPYIKVNEFSTLIDNNLPAIIMSVLMMLTGLYNLYVFFNSQKIITKYNEENA